MTKKYTVAVIGATGNVGREVLKALEEREFPVQDIIAAASSNSVGKQVSFRDDTINVLQMDKVNFAKIDIAFFCAGAKVSQKYAKIAAEDGCVVIDKSSHFRQDADVPLIVPEVNAIKLQNNNSKIIASPNCCAIPLAVALKPLDNASKIKRVVVSTYQSVSGAGKQAMDELYNQTKAKFLFGTIEPSVFSQQIAFNLIPQIGEFEEDGYTDEESKIKQELSKLLGDHIKSSVTCVRLPVFVCHSMSVNIEFEDDIDAKEVEEILYESDGVTVHSLDNEHKYVTPIEAVESDDVFISRVRNDASKKNTVNMWICTDNMRKGAGLNAVQIAEEIIKR